MVTGLAGMLAGVRFVERRRVQVKAGAAGRSSRSSPRLSCCPYRACPCRERGGAGGSAGVRRADPRRRRHCRCAGVDLAPPRPRFHQSCQTRSPWWTGDERDLGPGTDSRWALGRRGRAKLDLGRQRRQPDDLVIEADKREGTQVSRPMRRRAPSRRTARRSGFSTGTPRAPESRSHVRRSVTRRIEVATCAAVAGDESRLEESERLRGCGRALGDGRLDPAPACRPESGGSRALDVREPLNDVAVGGGAVWAISGPRSLRVPDRHPGPRSQDAHPLVNRLGETAPFPVQSSVGEGSVWVLNGNTQTVSKIDPEFGGVTATIPLGIGRNPSDLAAGAGAVWVANGGNGTLARIDPGRTPSPPSLSGTPHASLSGGPRLGERSARLQSACVACLRAGPSAPRRRSSRYPPPVCSPVEFQGAGTPATVIASDLPFQGQSGGA